MPMKRNERPAYTCCNSFKTDDSSVEQMLLFRFGNRVCVCVCVGGDPVI